MAVKYSVLESSDEKFEDGSIQELMYTPKRTRPSWIIPLFCHSFIFFAYSTIFFFGVPTRFDVKACTEKLSSWSPALSAVEYEERYFHGGIGALNDFRGETPSPDIDQKWMHISMNAPGVRLFEEDFVAMGKTLADRDWHQIPEEHGGGYLGMTEVFHLLHCLDAIRKLTYPDYYPDLWARRDTYQVRVHTDHCVDIIRQRLMCTGDVGPVPFYKDTNPLNQMPLPDFSTKHQCRNFDKLLDWSHSNDRALLWDQVGDLNLTHTHAAAAG